MAQLYLEIGETFTGMFVTHDDDSLANASSTPALSVYQNGTLLASAAVTVTNVTTGVYKYSFIASSANGFTANQFVEVVGTATVGDRSGGAVLKELRTVPASSGLAALAGTLASFLASLWSYTTRTLTSAGSITVVSPVVQGGNFTVIQGDSYDADDSRAIDWTFSNAPSLTGATVTLTAKRAGIEKAYPLTILTASSVRAEFTSAQTQELAKGDWKFTIQAALSGSGNVVTLLVGSMHVVDDPS